MFLKSWLCKDWWRAPKTISFLSIRNSWISERAGDASYLSSQQSWLIIVTCVAIWSTCSPDSSVPSCDDQSQIIPLHPFSLDFDLTLAENIFGALLTAGAFPPEFLSAGGSKRRKRVKLVSLPEPPAEERPPAKPPTELWYQAGKHDQQQKTSLCYVKFLDKLDKNPRSSWSGTWSSASTGARRSNWSRFKTSGKTISFKTTFSLHQANLRQKPKPQA